VIRYLVLVALSVGAALVAAPTKPGPGEIVPFQSMFMKFSGIRWVDRAAQAQAESGFDPMARSSAGAKGLMQAMPGTWSDYQRNGWVPKGADPFDPIPAIQGGCNYMNWIEPRVGGQLDPALVSFNWGLGNVLKVQRRVSALGEPGANAWIRYCPAESQSYIIHNRTNRARIRALGGRP
jgi:soluble lytic murein transglycosylase-like protein